MPLPKASTNPLSDLYDLIEKGTLQKDISFQGKTYRFRSLFDEDYNWRDQFINMNGPAALIASQRAPTLAIATVSIDDVPVEQIDELQKIDVEIPSTLREFIAANSKFLIAFNLKNLYNRLPRQYVAELYEKFLTEVEVPSKVIKEEDVKNS